MKNDAERWIHGEGPPPEAIRGMLEDARAASRKAREAEMSPELEAELHGLVAAAVDRERRARARRRRIKIGLAAFAGVAVAAGAVALVVVVRAGVPAGPNLMPEVAPNALMLAPAPSAAPSASAAGQPAKPAGGRPPAPR